MYRMTTDNIQVSVVPHFMADQSKPEVNQFFWSYTIEIWNQRNVPVQLLSRHWKITDATGALHEVKGQGVIGQQPVIAPGQRFEYTSGCPLETPQGFMVGSYEMLSHDGLHFKVDVPAFSLDSPFCHRVLN